MTDYMSQIIPIAFKYGFIFAGFFGFIGYLIGLLQDLFNSFGRG